MIASYISGRLGNQLFQYAFARAVQEHRGNADGLVMNFNFVTGAGRAEDGFENELRYFRVRPYYVDSGNLVMRYGNAQQRLLYLRYQLAAHLGHGRVNTEKWFSRFRRKGLLFSEYSNNDYELFAPWLSDRTTVNAPKDIITYGKFENPKFFEPVRQQLLSELTPREPELASNASLYEAIRQSNAVCISVRRGDFLDSRFKDNFLVCGRDYFIKAIEKMQSIVDNPSFVFFSDDISWVRENIKVDAPCLYESGNDPVWEKLRLMYSCNHFIISNSTFSWWAQWLGRDPEKIVISPDRWSNEPKRNAQSRLIADSFVKIGA